MWDSCTTLHEYEVRKLKPNLKVFEVTVWNFSCPMVGPGIRQQNSISQKARFIFVRRILMISTPPKQLLAMFKIEVKGKKLSVGSVRFPGS